MYVMYLNFLLSHNIYLLIITCPFFLRMICVRREIGAHTTKGKNINKKKFVCGKLKLNKNTTCTFILGKKIEEHEVDWKIDHLFFRMKSFVFICLFNKTQ